MVSNIRYRETPPETSPTRTDLSTRPLTRSNKSLAGSASSAQIPSIASISHPLANTDNRAHNGEPLGLLPRIGGSDLLAVLLIAGGVFASVWLGRREARLRRWPRYALNAGMVLLVAVAIGVLLSADQSTRRGSYQEVYYDHPYGHIEDVFPYDEQGRLLTGVRLFDQNGQPLRFGYRMCPDKLPGEELGDKGPAAEEWLRDKGTDMTYPACPERAPFRFGGPSGPSPSATARPSPSVTARPAPSPS
jgi:hypothetical protein